MNTAACLTRLTMIAATFAAAVTVQAAPPATRVDEIVTLPMVTVTGKRAPAAAQVAVVTMPMITVTGKRTHGTSPSLVAQKTGVAVKTTART